MNVTTTTTIQCRLDSGATLDLTANDCAAILNAMARRHLLTVVVESIPAEYEEIASDECCAWTQGCDEHDEEVVLSVNAGDFISGMERKKQAAKKSKKKSSR